MLGGGLSLNGSRWISGCRNFFLAVKPLSRLFRRLFLKRLQAAFDANGLGLAFGDLAYLADPVAFATHLAAVRRLDWIVYAKKPFGGRLRKFSPISAATRIASPSPTAASKPATTNMSGSPGRTIATTSP